MEAPLGRRLPTHAFEEVAHCTSTQCAAPWQPTHVDHFLDAAVELVWPVLLWWTLLRVVAVSFPELYEGLDTHQTGALREMNVRMMNGKVVRRLSVPNR